MASLKIYSKEQTDALLGAKADSSALASKQDALVSGTNIKTINGESVLGSGDIEIQGGGGVTLSPADYVALAIGRFACYPSTFESYHGTYFFNDDGTRTSIEGSNFVDVVVAGKTIKVRTSVAERVLSTSYYYVAVLFYYIIVDGITFQDMLVVAEADV